MVSACTTSRSCSNSALVTGFSGSGALSREDAGERWPEYEVDGGADGPDDVPTLSERMAGVLAAVADVLSSFGRRSDTSDEAAAEWGVGTMCFVPLVLDWTTTPSNSDRNRKFCKRCSVR